MADARKPASKPNPFVLDPAGDRRVLVNYGGEVATGLVSSHALRMASPVWKKFVNPPWKPVRVIAVKSTAEEVSQEESAEDQNSAAVNMEANNRKRKRAEIDTANNSHRYPENEENSVPPLDFREDDSDALLILFAIAHARFKYVPQRFMADAELLNLAILCEKYQCLNLVAPFLKCWASLQSVRDSGKGHYISWVFGWENSFGKNAIDMLRCTQLEGKDLAVPVVIVNGRPHTNLVVPGLIEKILEIRAEVIQQILDVYYDYIADIEMGKHACKKDTDKGRCAELIYGSLLLGLIVLKLWPRKEPRQVPYNICHLNRVLKSMTVNTLAEHEHCFGISYYQRILLIEGSQSPVIEAHTRHMQKAQAILRESQG